MTINTGTDLNRFIDAQDFYYDIAYKELCKGKKKTHWMWFIFPQLGGLGTSATSIKYAIRSKQEAISYLESAAKHFEIMLKLRNYSYSNIPRVLIHSL